MEMNTIKTKIVKNPMFYALLFMASAYPIILVSTDYLTSDYVLVPFRWTATLYLIGVSLFLYGIPALYTSEIETITIKSVLGCLAVLAGEFIFAIGVLCTLPRFCMCIPGPLD